MRNNPQISEASHKSLVLASVKPTLALIGQVGSAEPSSSSKDAET